MIDINLDFLKYKPGNIIFRNSGGPDCAILMHITAKYIKDNGLGIKFYHVTVDTPTKFYYIKYAKKIIMYLKNTFDMDCEYHYTKIANVGVLLEDDGYETVYGYSETQSSMVKELMNTHTDILYEFTGASNMLNPEILSQFGKRITDKSRMGESIKEVHRGRSYTPFINMNKMDIRLLYEEYGVMDTLFPLTRSCEIQSSDIKFNTVQDGHCGSCIFCIERKFAFGKL